MLDLYITFYSVTPALQAQRCCEGAGIPAKLTRAPKSISELGCGYAVGIQTCDMARAVQELRRRGVQFRRVVRLKAGGQVEEAGV